MARFTSPKPLIAAALMAITAGSAGLADTALTAEEAGEAHVATLGAAFPDGWVAGQFQSWNDAGELTNSESNPECVSPAKRADFAQAMGGLLKAMTSTGQCQLVAYQPGTLRYSAVCTVDDRTMSYDANGEVLKDGVDVMIKLRATGPGAPDLGSMKVTARRQRDCTPAESATAAAADAAEKS